VAVEEIKIDFTEKFDQKPAVEGQPGVDTVPKLRYTDKYCAPV